MGGLLPFWLRISLTERTLFAKYCARRMPQLWWRRSLRGHCGDGAYALFDESSRLANSINLLMSYELLRLLTKPRSLPSEFIGRDILRRRSWQNYCHCRPSSACFAIFMEIFTPATFSSQLAQQRPFLSTSIRQRKDLQSRIPLA